MTDQKDLIARLRKNSGRSSELDPYIQQMIDEAADALERYAEHETRCAGEFVPVGERLPEPGIVVQGFVRLADKKPVVGTDWIRPRIGGWYMHENAYWSHWFDVRLPGGEG